MNNYILLLVFFLASIFNNNLYSQSFKEQQKKYARVKTAYNEKESIVKKIFSDKNIPLNEAYIYVRIFKEEKIIELWARKKNKTNYIHICDYSICESSGKLGPKRKEGDMQTPEGFYIINTFNPFSNFYLSLGINYPNKSDKILVSGNRTGGSIFIHGNCVTIGCVPITDDKIKELYIIAVEVKNNGQTEIPVHIFPFRMGKENVDVFYKKYSDDDVLIKFWKNIKAGYDYFESNKALPKISVDKAGKYVFN